jgi:hypothetical protein
MQGMAGRLHEDCGWNTTRNPLVALLWPSVRRRMIGIIFASIFLKAEATARCCDGMVARLGGRAVTPPKPFPKLPQQPTVCLHPSGRLGVTILPRQRQSR